MGIYRNVPFDGGVAWGDWGLCGVENRGEVHISEAVDRDEKRLVFVHEDEC